MFCKQCGKEIPENSNFCIYCGASQAAAEPAGETVIEPVPQAGEPAAQPELVVEPGPAPEAPPAPELVFDQPVPEAAPAPKAQEPEPMPLPDPVPEPAPMPLPDPVAEPAPKADEPAPMPLPEPVPGPTTGGPAGGPPPVPPTPTQPAGAAPSNGGVSYDLLLKIFAAVCGVICLLRALGSIGGVFSNLFSLVRYASIPSLFYAVLNLATVVCYLGAAAMLALLALRRTKENTEALVFGLVASAAGLLIVRLLSVFVSILLNVVFFRFFNFSMLLSYLGGLLGLAFGAARRLADLCLIFCLDDAGRLFAVNAREDTQFRRADLFWFVRLQRRLRNMVAGGALAAHLQEPTSLTGLEPEILEVESIRETPGRLTVTCRVKMPNGGTTRRFYSLGKALRAPDLLRLLEQRQPADCRLERPGDPLLAWVVACAALLAGAAAACVLCHPTVGRLPSDYYFPLLGLAFLLFCALVALVCVRHRNR